MMCLSIFRKCKISNIYKSKKLFSENKLALKENIHYKWFDMTVDTLSKTTENYF